MTLCYISMQYRNKFRICMAMIHVFNNCPIWERISYCSRCLFYIPIPILDRLFNEWAYASATWGDPYDL
jgi:hypothetical protein